MKLTRLHHYLLRFLYRRLAKHGAVHFCELPRAFEGSRFDITQALHELGSQGLVDPEKLRLTFAGLAVAVAFAPRRSRQAARTAVAQVAPNGRSGWPRQASTSLQLKRGVKAKGYPDSYDQA